MATEAGYPLRALENQVTHGPELGCRPDHLETIAGLGEVARRGNEVVGFLGRRRGVGCEGGADG